MSKSPPFEFRSYAQAVRRKDGSRRIAGTCAPYNKPSRDLGPFIEVIEAPAFAGGLGMGFPGVVANLEHNPSARLATVDSGTFDISDTKTGLDYALECPKTSCENDSLEYVDSGLIKGSSIQMRVRGDHFEHGGTGVITRHLDEVQLMAISPVATPAYSDATVQRRSLDLAIASFAMQFDASDDEVRRDFETGNTARYFDNRHPVVIDVGSAVEARSGDDVEWRRRKNGLGPPRFLPVPSAGPGRSGRMPRIAHHDAGTAYNKANGSEGFLARQQPSHDVRQRAVGARHLAPRSRRAAPDVYPFAGNHLDQVDSSTTCPAWLAYLFTTNKTAQTTIRRLVKFYVDGDPVALPGILVSALRG